MKWLYRITNTVSGKQYIGVTIDPDRRWRQHRTKNTSSSALKCAIDSYGSDVFNFELLFYGEDRYVDTLEVEFIKDYNTVVPNGYNITLGGDGGNLYEWNDEWNKLLGTDTDKNIAKVVGLSLDVVSSRRKGLQIPPYKDSKLIDWKKHIEVLGTAPDIEIAKTLGVTANRVYQIRKEYGIAPFTPPPPTYTLPAGLISTLGKKSDTDLANEYEVSFTSVYNKRVSLGIDKFIPEEGHRKITWTKEQEILLKDTSKTQKEVAETLGVSVSSVGRYRKDNNVSRYTGKSTNGRLNFIPLEGEFLEDLLNSELSNKDLSLKYGYKTSTLWAKRKSKKFIKIKEEREVGK